MRNFWEQMQKPIMCLAPMADVTDSAFRHIIAKYSKQGGVPYVTWTEFVSADGLRLAPDVGRKKLLKDLEYSEIERPIVAQFFTSNLESMRYAAKLALDLGFDGVDINMGCPDKSIEKQGAGAALMKNPELARDIIRAAKEGCEDKIPVSVKTRLGYNKDELEEWLPELLAENPAVITIHARTRKEMSKVPARWERVKRAVEIRDCVPASQTLIIGNGDVENVEDAYKKVAETWCDGVMLGRAIFGNPWLFSNHSPTSKERLEVMLEHTKLFEKNLGSVKSFAIMKKHFKSYVKGFEGAEGLRSELMASENAADVGDILAKYFAS